jgi:UDP-N-acetylmuramate dehydrogenase
MKTQKNKPLAPLTSFKVGGKAESYVLVDDIDKLVAGLLAEKYKKPLWVLGFGTNVVISDKGLPGTVLHVDTKEIKLINETTIAADAGVWWDDLVQFSIKHGLWGMELASGIPGGVGAAIKANVAAYGQAATDHLLWVESVDLTHPELGVFKTKKIDLKARYHESVFQEGEFKDHLIVRAVFNLSKTKTKELEYQHAIIVADDMGWDVDTLKERRKVIMETRLRQGSLYDPDDNNAIKTGGSFFRNPDVDPETAEKVLDFDEYGMTKSQIKKQQHDHTGSATRVSGALVLLAAGYHRGQTWGNVRIYPHHMLKIENTGQASAQELYDVGQEIIITVKDKLGVDIRPEVRFLGDFSGRA